MGQHSTKLQQIHNSALEESALPDCGRWCTPRPTDNVAKGEECFVSPPLSPDQNSPLSPPTSAEPCTTAAPTETQRGDIDETPLVTGPTKPMFFVNCYNGAHLVLPVLGRLEWNRVYDRREIPNCCFRWTETVLQLNYQIFKECEQMVNHIPNCGHLTNKLGLLLSVRDYAAKRRLTSRRDASLNFLPETYWIDDPKEKQTFLNKFCNEQLWIFKPCGLNQGKGISLIRSHVDFDRIEAARMEELRRNPRMCRPRIVQRYLINPLVLKDRKFDIRCYLMIVSTMPYLVLFSPGYVRLSLRRYNPYDTDLVTHLTNQFVQKKDPHYKKSKDDTVWTFNRLNEYINTHVAPVRRLQRNWVTRHLLPEMHRISTHVFCAVKDKLACRVGFFEIYGMDFMVDNSLKVWLIEINSNPAMNTNCEALRQVIPPIVNKFIQISIECFEKARRWQPLLPILGIRARDPPDANDPPDCDSWCVKLRSSPRSLVNNGLPVNFTILYHESLTTARARQTKSYKIPLRLWVPPKMYLPVPPPRHGLVVTTSPSVAETEVATARVGSKKPSPRLTPSSQKQVPPMSSSTRSMSSPAYSLHYSKPPTPGLRETLINPTPPVRSNERTLSAAFKKSSTESPTKKGLGDLVEGAELNTGLAEPICRSYATPISLSDAGSQVDADFSSSLVIQSDITTGGFIMNPRLSSYNGTLSASWTPKARHSKFMKSGLAVQKSPKRQPSSSNMQATSHNSAPLPRNLVRLKRRRRRRRRRMINHNSNCSVKVPSLVANLVLSSSTSFAPPPLPPLVLTPDALTQPQNDTTNEEHENYTTDTIGNSIGPTVQMH